MNRNINGTPQIGVAKALERLRAGAMVLVTDDAGREHEADLILAAEHVTPAAIAFMITHGRGLVCLALTGQRVDALGLPAMVAPEQHNEAHGTAFTVSVDARVGTTTGISAQDRAQTIRVLIGSISGADDLRRPGHVFPLRANAQGVLGRAGHTEAAVDLARLAGLQPAGVICEVLDDDGRALRGERLYAFARHFDLGIVTIADLIAYRWHNDHLVERGAEASLPTTEATFRAIDYRDVITNEHHVALVKGDLAGAGPVLVRLHSECLTGDALGSLRCDCGDQLRLAQAAIAAEGRGVLLYLRQEGRGIGLPAKLQAYALQDAGFDTVEANEQLGYAADARHYGVAAQILRHLGIQRLSILTNNPAKVAALAGYGFDVVERFPLIAPERQERRHYLDTKRSKLGHLLPAGAETAAAPPRRAEVEEHNEERIAVHGV